MDLINLNSNHKNQSKSIAIGGFDGMHYAHQEVIKKVECLLCIGIEYSNLTPKLYRTSHTNIDIIGIELKHIKHLHPKEFIDLLHKIFPKLESISVGYDFRFGNNRKGNINILKDLCNEKINIIKEIKLEGISVHSKTIRDMMSEGNIKLANKLLSYNYIIIGDSIRGQGLGSKKLFPTINLKCEDFHIPKSAVYKTITYIDNTKHSSVTFIGERSTDGKFSIETHIINKVLDKSSYKDVKVEFIDKIRDNKKFNSLEELKNQIRIDITHSYNQ